MTQNALHAIFAQAAPSGQQGPAGGLAQLGIFIPMIIIFYFVLIRPQQKKAKEHAALLKTLKSGDKVMVNGGIIATVVTVKDNTATVRSVDTKLEVLKSAVTEILERGGADSKES